VIGALALLGSPATRLGLPIEAMATIDNALSSPAECPLCRTRVPLEDLVPQSMRASLGARFSHHPGVPSEPGGR
jgi:hypothetical protein